MTTLKMHFACLFLLFSLCVDAQQYTTDLPEYPDGYKWGAYPNDLFPLETQEEEAVLPQSLLARTKAIYTTLRRGDFRSIEAYFGRQMNWNGQKRYSFQGQSLSTAVFFNASESDWTDWKLYDLTYQELSTEVIMVRGRYQATRQGLKTDAPFMHLWTWDAKQVAEFQHYESTQVVTSH